MARREDPGSHPRTRAKAGGGVPTPATPGPPRSRAISLVAALAFASAFAGSTRAEDGARSPTGAVRIEPGLKVSYEYHFDRNAFAASVDAPGGLVALTRSGNLLRFDPATRKRDREWSGPSRITCLAPGEGASALVGFEDGRIARLDPATLAMEPVAQLPGKPHWLGYRPGDARSPGGIVAVVERWKWVDASFDGLSQVGFPLRPDEPAPVGLPGRNGKTREEWRPCSEVHDLGSGRSAAIRGRATAVFLDARRRAWLGFEYGEFGGWCRCVDLSGGQARVVRGAFDPPDERRAFWGCVSGFAERPDGAIWLLGGMDSIAIRRVDGPEVEVLVEFERDFDRGDFGPGKPDGPILRIVDEPGKTGSILALTDANSLFRTDATLKRWERVLELSLRDPTGPPVPVVREIHPRGDGLLLATARDGYVLTRGDRQEEDPLPGQLEAGPIDEIRATATAAGPIFVYPSSENPWHLRDGRWANDPPEPSDGPASAFTAPDGSAWDVSETGDDQHLILRRRIGERWEAVAALPGAEPSDVRIEHLDGGEFLFWAAGEEIRMRKSADPAFPGRFLRGWSIGDRLRIVDPTGPPWVIFDRDEGRLLALSYGLDFRDPALKPLAVVEAGLPLKVRDAIAGGPGELLLATRKGLFIYEVATGRHHPAPLPSIDPSVRRLARDGLGRLWLGGDGLWMVDGAGRLRDLAAVPMVGRSAVEALAADPGHRDGAIVSLGPRGVAFLRVEASP